MAQPQSICANPDLAQTGIVRSPFKSGPKAALREMQPEDPEGPAASIKIDVAHTYAINGYGKDDLGSAIVFLACRCGLFGGNSIPVQLDRAFTHFKNWCIENKKTTSLTDFDLGTLKIKSFLDHQTWGNIF